MMEFREVKNAVAQTLVDAAAGRFLVVGHQRQQKAAEASVGNNRLVEVYFKRESFSKSRGRANGPVAGDVTIAIELTVAEPAKADLSALNNPNATPTELSTALFNMKEAGAAADEAMDELAEIVYQILMDARNIYYGLGKGRVNGRWVSDIEKDQPNDRGGLVLLTGAMNIEMRVSEEVPGDTGVDLDSISMETIIKDDTIQKTGFEV